MTKQQRRKAIRQALAYLKGDRYSWTVFDGDIDEWSITNWLENALP